MKRPKYTAGEIADLLGITTVALRNYEKLGLVLPERNEKNNYRQFNAIAFNILRRVRSYIGLGCSMREAVSLVQERTVADLPQIFRAKADALQKSIEHDQQLLSYLQQRSEHLARISASEGECFVENSPGLYAILYRRDLEISSDVQLRRLVREWNKLYPFVDATAYYPAACFNGGKTEYWHGLCIEERFAGYFGIKESKYIRYYPPRKSVYTFKFCQYEPDTFGRCFSFSYAADWIASRGFKVNGDAIGRAIHSEQILGKPVHDVEVWIPIE